ncbi:HD-GYP domain-containing protein [Desulfovibrio sp.]|uniref:HD-GYP domain-containing protein n=1 Tax=Desulfovibrio TaxID=872 RepID=UPI0025C32CFA|nr:HD domain-containing phosphohydrolase [Desulfovibrio sp.]
MLCHSRLNLAENATRHEKLVPCSSAVTEIIHQLAESLGKAIDAKDTYTLAHSEEVAIISQALALAMGLGHQAADIIHVAGHLHDLGKIGVPDDILAKTSALTPKEWLAIRKHPDMGADILAPIACLRDCGIVDMVRAHHERFDGNGYPQGLKGGHIPLGARIITVADSLSAMLQSRPYRQAKTFDEACREIIKGTSSQFDPDVVKAFMSIRDRLRDLVAMLRAD